MEGFSGGGDTHEPTSFIRGDRRNLAKESNSD